MTDELKTASSYGGGFNVAGRPIRQTQIDLRTSTSRFGKATQKNRDVETDLGLKRNKLRKQISDLETEAITLRGHIAIRVCFSQPERRLVIQD